jgi:hypothetical protein
MKDQRSEIIKRLGLGLAPASEAGQARCPSWVKTGKAQCEQMFSAVHPTTDIDRLRAKIMIYAQSR